MGISHRVLCLAALLYSAAAAALTPLSLEETVTLRRVTAAMLSPDGERIAYLLSVPRELYKDADGKPWQELHVAALDGTSRAFVAGKVQVQQAAWSHDGAALYFVAKRDPDGKFGSLHRIPSDGGEAAEIFSHTNAISAIYPSPDGTRLAFLAAAAPPDQQEALARQGFKAVVYEESVPATHVWQLDLTTGAASKVELDGSVSQLAWAPNGKRYAVAIAPSPLTDDFYTARDILIVAADTGTVERSLDVTGKLGEFTWSPDSQELAWIGSTDRNDPREGRLYVSRADTGARRELLPDYPGHIWDLSWHQQDTIHYLGYRGLWTEVTAVAAATPAAAGRAPTGGPIVRRISGHTGSNVLVAVADAPTHPAEVYVMQDGSWRRLTDSNPLLAERTLAKQEAIQYAARDGLVLDAILVRPLAKAKRGKPLILFIHGGPESHYVNGWLGWYSQPVHTLAAQGYTIAYPNYRGSTGRGVAFSKLSQNKLGEAEFDDIVDLKRHLVKQGLADTDLVGISGGSYGGYASMWGATKLSAEFAAAVAFVGISNQISEFGTGDIAQEMFDVHTRDWPWDNWLVALKRSPIYYAEQARTPLLIMAGDKDPRVHPAQSLEMYRHIKLRTSTPVRLVFYPGEGHGNDRTAAQFDYALRFERWMSFYLQGTGSGIPDYQIEHAARLDSTD